MSTESLERQAEILQVLDRFSEALCQRDLAALATCYAEDVRVFDIGTQQSGFDKLRALWESCFPYFPHPIETHRKDMQIIAGPEVAVATFFSRLSGMDSDHPSAKSWVRTTVVFQKIEGDWKIVHDHASFPVDCGAETPTYLLD